MCNNENDPYELIYEDVPNIYFKWDTHHFPNSMQNEVPFVLNITYVATIYDKIHPLGLSVVISEE